MVAYEQSSLCDIHKSVNQACGAFTISSFYVCDRCGAPWGSPECDCDDTCHAQRIFEVDLQKLFGRYISLSPETSTIWIAEPKGGEGFWEIVGRDRLGSI